MKHVQKLFEYLESVWTFIKPRAQMMKKRKIICQFQKFALVHYYYFEVIKMDQGELFSQFIMGRLYHNVVIRKMDIVLYQN